MIRLHTSVTQEEYDAAKREADRLGISLAELLRRSLRHILPVDESKPWMRYTGMIQTGDPRSSRRIDEVVYGEKDLGLPLVSARRANRRRPVGAIEND